MEYTAYVKGLEKIKKYTPQGKEFWMGRELQPLLGYDKWENFEKAIQRAMEAAKSGGMAVPNHFLEAGKMVPIGSGAMREKADWFLSRGACYIIAMNSDPNKEEVGHAMIYFAAQARRQEISDKKTISEEERLRLRLRVMAGNKRLAGVAKHAGVVHHAFFQDAGIQGLYGRPLTQVKAYKGLAQDDDLLDHAGTLELSANDFRIQLAADRLNRNNVHSEADAIQTHRSVGQYVRETMERDNGVQPENLPIEQSIKPLVRKHQRLLKKTATKTQPELLS